MIGLHALSTGWPLGISGSHSWPRTHNSIISSNSGGRRPTDGTATVPPTGCSSCVYVSLGLGGMGGRVGGRRGGL